jgi:HK97 family phage major capsid protein
MDIPELLALRGRTADIRADIEAAEKKTPALQVREADNGRNGAFEGLRMSDPTPEQRERMANPPADVPAQPSHEQMAQERRDADRSYRPSAREVRGNAFEKLSAGQSVAEWHRKAVANGHIRSNGTDRDIERYWQERFGFKAASVESRALGEGTSSGSGAAAAVVPDVWAADFIDLLRANLVLPDATIMPMSSVRYHMPVFAADVAPAYVAENASTNLDGNPGFSPLIFDASGAYIDVTLMSRQVLEDASQSSGLTTLLEGTIARKYARLIENVALFGNAAVASLVPGLAGESGVQHFAAESTLADYDDFSKAVELVRNKNSEPSGIITNPSVAGTFERLKASTYAKYWTPPASVAALWPPRTSTAMPNTETAAAAAETGGALSSAFVGDFSNVVLGMRVELQVDVLKERYADQGQIGLVSYLRFCPRVVHPETFVRVTDIATS